MSDYFNEFLVNEWNALDQDLSTDRFLAREQERQETYQQQEIQESLSSDKDKDQIQPEDLHSPYDRKKAKETKEQRLQRIKEEYSAPFVSVGQLRQRRTKRERDLAKILKKLDYPQEALQDPAIDGTMANSPGFTQLVEQNEATIKPASVLRFTK